MTTSSLEITIRQRNGRYLADARYRPDDARPELLTLAEAAPTALSPPALSAYIDRPEAYGPQLAAQLFADEQLQAAWQRARVAQERPGNTLRLWVRMPATDPLQALRWELLTDPISNRPIATEEGVSIIRATTAVRLSEITSPDAPELRASVVVAQPGKLEGLSLCEIDIDGEHRRAQKALAGFQVSYIGDPPEQRATRAALRQAIQSGPHILYLVGHSLPDPEQGDPCLLLEHADGSADLLSGPALIGELRQAVGGPLRLLVLAARRREASGYGGALSQLGPQLAHLGIPAVLSFQGDISLGTARQLLTALFAELRQDGRVDRSLASVRRAMASAGAWWQPVLWLGDGDGRLWHSPHARPIDASAVGPATSQIEQLNTATLRRLLNDAFSDSELRDLCIDLGDIDFESLAGPGKRDKVRELISFLERRGRLAELLRYCNQERPNLGWDQVFEPAAPELPQVEPEPAPPGLPPHLHTYRVTPGEGAAAHATLDAIEIQLEQEPADLTTAQALAELFESPHIPFDQRLRAADIAGRSIDLRFPVSDEHWQQSITGRSDTFGQPRGYWCFVPGGAYSIGGPAQGQAQVAMSGFWIARHPITVGQYRRFIESGGYNTADWWSPQGWAWRQSGAITSLPWGWGDRRYARPNQPVIGLGLDEASAFCRWLQARLSGALRSYTIRLPTEAEWEVAAARGADGELRLYPWGAEPPSIEHAIHKSELQHYRQPAPAPIGCTIQGAAACGALDLAGNIWELVATGWDQYPAESNRLPDSADHDYSVSRGGAWSSTYHDLTCLARDRSRRPHHNLEHGGFRVALVSNSLS